MPTVNTVLGPVDVDDLKFTLMHEHVMVSSAGIPHTFPELIDTDRFVTLSVQALKEAAADGVNTYVDVTTMDLGRDVVVLQRLAEQSEVHIIPCTGIWLDIPRAISRITPEELARVFIREIEVGIEGTGIKAGIIKVATSEEGVTPANDIVLRAAAMTCNETGVPISTHTAAMAKVGNDQDGDLSRRRASTSAGCTSATATTPQTLTTCPALPARDACWVWTTTRADAPAD